ncbi:unnamed protein product [Clonostachys rosea]|uniref:NmrA-like domain-containing protein n=1 Tax=Bionectria ochroleuca TaxID=29856 RepID=A0ABY6UG76_BIOOC|nr:unnamed protein product [Clonostachys rosea]
MGIIAVAGGTGGVGRALVEAIVARGKHDVKILSRNASHAAKHSRLLKANDAAAVEIGVPIVVVDYGSFESLTNVFEENNFDTVISALSTMPQEGTPPEVNMIRAAQASKSTRRFIPSNWALPIRGEIAKLLPSSGMKTQALEALEKTDLEWTVFYAGFFTDFYATPAIKTYLNPMTAVIDLEHNMAAIPGTGNTPVSFIHTFDLAKLVDRALDFEKWDPEYYVVGDSLTWNDFARTVEAVRGTKLTIVYDSVEDLKQGKATELPALTKALPFIPIPREAMLSFIATFGLLFDGGVMNFNHKDTLNKKFPDIKTLSVKEALEANV